MDEAAGRPAGTESRGEKRPGEAAARGSTPPEGDPSPAAGGMLQRALIGAVRFYRRGISPLKPPVCRFEPTCSAYALEALERHGAFRGTYLTVWRILRCQPFSKGGYDPVP